MRRIGPILVGFSFLLLLGAVCSQGNRGVIATISSTSTFNFTPAHPLVSKSTSTSTVAIPFTSEATYLSNIITTITPTPNITITPILDPLACLSQDTKSEIGLVQWISSGDTIVVDIMGRLKTVRYLGVDAPDLFPIADYRGPTAARFNEKLVRNQLVRLIRDGLNEDPSGQLLRYVLIGDLFVNYELVRQGLAFTLLPTPGIVCADTFLRAEELAQKEVLGVWKPTRTPHCTSTQMENLTATMRPVSTPTITSMKQTSPTALVTLSSTPTIQPVSTPTSMVTITSTLTATETRDVIVIGDISIIDLLYEGEKNQEADECVEIYNHGKQSIQLSGWKLNDAQNHVFNISVGCTLEFD